MEQPSGGDRGAAWRAGFQRKYLSRLVATLSHVKIRRATGVSTRCRTVKLAAYVSLAMTARGQTAWSRAILRKYLFRLQKSPWQLRVVKSRRNLYGIRRSASANRRPGKQTAVCRKPSRRLVRTASRTGHNCKEEARGTMASSIQTLRLLVPGSRGLDTLVFLKEATDYIIALKMQVQAMQALADCYSNSSA